MSHNIPPKTLARFWGKVRKTETCWLWTAGKSRAYGAFTAKCLAGNQIGAHRVSWLIAFGPVPIGLEVCHTCDVPLCVNPAHLFLGTTQDNTRDSTVKNRRAKGTRNGHHVLSDDDAREIRRRYDANRSAARVHRRTTPFAPFTGETCADIARDYGVHASMVGRIGRREHWRHVR